MEKVENKVHIRTYSMWVHAYVCVRMCVCYLLQDGLLLDVHLHNVHDIKCPRCGCFECFNAMSTKVLQKGKTAKCVCTIVCMCMLVCVCVCL